MSEHNIYEVNLKRASDGDETFYVVPAHNADEALAMAKRHMEEMFQGYPAKYSNIKVELIADSIDFLGHTEHFWKEAKND